MMMRTTPPEGEAVATLIKAELNKHKRSIQPNTISVILPEELERPMPSLERNVQGFVAYCTKHTLTYLFSVGVMALLYPFSQKTMAPLLSSIFPTSHTSLEKSLLIITVMYWLPIVIEGVRRWVKDEY
jgi:hypothetical protein